MVTLFGVRTVGRPLQQLIAQTEKIGKGDFSGRLALHTHDELSQLAVALNHMSAQLEEQQAEIGAESTARIAAVEQLREDGQGALRGIGAPAAVVGPDMAPVVDASLFGPGGKDKNIGAVGHHAGVVVVRAPAFRAFVEVIFYHDLP